MKRFVSLCLTIAMLAMPFLALGEDLGLLDTQVLPPPEKLKRQIRDGSRFHGQLSLELTGETLLSSLLGNAMNGAALDFIHIRTGLTGDASRTELTFLNGEKTQSLLKIDEREGQYLVLWDMLETPFVFNALNAAESLFKGGDTAWEQVALALLTAEDAAWKKDLETALESYYAALELWLVDLAGTPQAKEGGMVAMEYIITPDQLKNGIRMLIEKMVQDTALTGILNKHLSDEQMAAYFNPDMLEYYMFVIEQWLMVEDNIVIIQESSARGDQRRTQIRMPLPKNDYNLNRLDITVTDVETIFTLVTDTASYAFTRLTGEDGVTAGHVRYTPNEAQEGFALAFRYTAATEEWTDEEGKLNIKEVKALELEPEVGSAPVFEKTLFTLTMAYRSGSAKSNPVTVTAELQEQRGTASAFIRLNGKTASAITPEPMVWEGVQAWDLEKWVGECLKGLSALAAGYTLAGE